MGLPSSRGCSRSLSELQNLVTFIKYKFLFPRHILDRRQESVSRVEVLEPHPVGGPSHQELTVSSTWAPHLLGSRSSGRLGACLRLIGTYAAWMKCGLDLTRVRSRLSRRVEVLGQGGHGLVAVQGSEEEVGEILNMTPWQSSRSTAPYDLGVEER